MKNKKFIINISPGEKILSVTKLNWNILHSEKEKIMKQLIIQKATFTMIPKRYTILIIIDSIFSAN